MARQEVNGNPKSRTSKKELTLEQRLAKALAHPLRVEVLGLMNFREWSPRELSTHVGVGLSQVSYHVKVLKDYKLIEMTRTAPSRGATEHFYRALRRAWAPSGMAKYIPKSAQGIIGNSILKKVDKDVAASLKSGRFYDRDDWHTSWTPLNFDEQAREDAEKDIDEFIERMVTREAESANRRRNGEGSGEQVWTSVAVLLFGSDTAEQDRQAVRENGRKKTKRR